MADQLEILIKAKLDEAKSASQIKSQLKGIESQINSAEGIKFKAKIDDKSAVQSANAYSTTIQKAIDKKPITLKVTTEKGILNNRIDAYLERNTKAAKKMGFEFESLRQKISGVTDAKGMASLRKEFTMLTSSASARGLLGRDPFSEFKNNITKFTTWLGSGTIIMTAIRGFRSMLNSIKDVDSAMVELRKVTPATAGEFDSFFQRSRKSAVDLHASLTDLINSTANFSRLGYGLEPAEALAKNAVILKNVGDDIENIDDASDTIISAMKAFGIEAEDSMQIVDKLNNVGNNTSISSGGLAEGIKRSASAMAEANNSLDQTIGLIVAGNEVVRNPEMVGTGLKTMSLRIRGVDSDLEEMGETIDEMVTNTPKLQSMIKRITGVDIMQDATTFKSTYDILKEISKVWKDIEDIDQAAVLEALFGKRQANIGASILSNFDSAELALDFSINADGSAMDEYNIWVDSIEAKLARLQAQYESFATSFISSDFIKGSVDVGTGILGFLTSVVDKFGALQVMIPTILTGLSLFANKGIMQTYQDIDGNIGFGTFWGNQKKDIAKDIEIFKESDLQLISEYDTLLKQIGATGNESYTKLDAFNQTIGQGSEILRNSVSVTSNAQQAKEKYSVAIESATNKTKTFSLATTAASIGSKLLSTAINSLISVGVGFAITAIVKGIDSLIHKQDNLIAKAKESREEFASFTTENNEAISSLSSLEEEFNSLSLGVDSHGQNISLTADEYDRYKEIVAQIISISPELGNYLNEENDLLDEKNNLLERAIELREREYQLELLKKTSSDSIEEQIKGYAAEYEKAQGDFTKNVETYSDVFSSISPDWDESGLGFKSGIEEYLNMIESIGLDVEATFGETRENLIAAFGHLNIAGFFSEYYAEVNQVSSQNYDKIIGFYLSKKDEIIRARQDWNMSDSDESASNDFTEILGQLENAMGASALITNDIEVINQGLRNELSLVAQTVSGFDSLSDSRKDFVNMWAGSFSIEDIINSGQSYKSFVGGFKVDMRNLINKLSNPDSNISGLFDKLFGLDRDNLKASQYIAQANSLIHEILDGVNIDPDSKAAEMFFSMFDLDGDQLIKAKRLLIDSLSVSDESFSVQNFVNDLSVDEVILFAREVRNGATSLEEIIANLEAAKSESQNFKAEYEDLAGILENVTSAQGLFNTALDEQSKTGSISNETLNKLLTINEDYLNVLDDQGGKLTLNSDKFKELNNQILETKKAEVDASLAAHIWKSAIEGSTSQTQAQIAELALLSQEYQYAMSNLYAWEQAQSAPDDGDLYNKGKQAFDQIADGFNTGKVGTEKFEAAKNLLIPQWVYEQGLEAAEEYAKNLSSFFSDEKFAISGAWDTLVKNDMAKVLDDGSWELNPDVKIEDLASALNLTEDMVRMWIDLNEAYGITFDFDDESFTSGVDALNSLIDGIKTYNQLSDKTNQSGGVLSGTDANSLANASKEINDSIKYLQELPDEILIEMGITRDDEGLLQIENLNGESIKITPEMDTEQALAAIEVLQEKKDIVAKDKTTKITTVVNDTALDSLIAKLRSVTNRSWTINVNTVHTSNSSSGSNEYLPGSGNTIKPTSVDGTAYSNGTGNRSIGAKRTGKALLGELAPEMVVDRKTGTWFLAGMHGAEFVNINRGDIVFNGEQTKQLLANGFTNTRGKALVDGTLSGDAYLSGSGGLYSSKYDWSNWSSKGTVTNKNNGYATNANNLGNTRATTEAIKEQKIEIDRLHKAQQRLNDIQSNRDILKAKLDMTDNLSMQINLMRQINQEYLYEQDALHNLNNQRDQWISENIAELSKNGFNIIWDADYNKIVVDNMEHLHDLSDDTAQEMKKLIDKTLDLNDANRKASLEWHNISKAMREAKLEMADMALEVYSDYIKYMSDFELWDHTSDSKLEALYRQLEDITQLYIDGLIPSAEEYNKRLRETALEIYKEQKSAIETVIDKTKELIKWEVQQYKELVNLRKEALKDEKKEDDYAKEREKKLKDISKLQQQINRLSRDDSREAQAERMALEEELAKLQEDLADYQRDYAIDKHEEALDNEIKYAEETINSEAKLYQLAIDRINNDWENLYKDLIDWNAEAGKGIAGENSIKSAWEDATEALKKYGDVLSALDSIKTENSASEHTKSQVMSKLSQMESNSAAWSSASPEERKRLEKVNETLAKEISSLIGKNIIKQNGTWYLDDGSGQKLYDFLNNSSISNPVDTNNTAQVTSLVNKMKTNSNSWHNTPEKQQQAAKENESLARQVQQLIGQSVVKGSDGVWYIGKVGGKRLYDVYHEGGRVGVPETLKDDEVFAKLRKNERVVTENMWNNLSRHFDFIDKVKRNMIDSFDNLPMFPKTSHIQDLLKSKKESSAPAVQPLQINISVPVRYDNSATDKEVEAFGDIVGESAAHSFANELNRLGIKFEDMKTQNT